MKKRIDTEKKLCYSLQKENENRDISPKKNAVGE